jgi:hypothetical protein
MFIFKQSSLPTSTPAGSCTEEQLAGGVTVLSSTHGETGCGGFHRSGPIGGAAYGMPRKPQDAPRSTPWTFPSSVVTRHDGVCMFASPAATHATMAQARTTRGVLIRRFMLTS